MSSPTPPPPLRNYSSTTLVRSDAMLRSAIAAPVGPFLCSSYCDVLLAESVLYVTVPLCLLILNPVRWSSRNTPFRFLTCNMMAAAFGTKHKKHKENLTQIVCVTRSSYRPCPDDSATSCFGSQPPRRKTDNKFSSFQRQLNLYGFRKVVKGRESGCYMHPSFLRDNPEKLTEVRYATPARVAFPIIVVH